MAKKHRRKGQKSRPDVNQRMEEIHDNFMQNFRAAQAKQRLKSISLGQELPKTKYPFTMIRERYKVLHHPAIREFNSSMSGKGVSMTINNAQKLERCNTNNDEMESSENIEPTNPSKCIHEQGRASQNGAVHLDLPPLSKSLEKALVNLRDDMMLFDDVWFHDVFGDAMEWHFAKKGDYPRGVIVLNFLSVFVNNQLRYKNEFADTFQKTLPIGDRLKKRVCMFAATHQFLLGNMMVELVHSVCRWDGIVCSMFGQVGQVSSFARKYRNVCQLFGFSRLKPGDDGKQIYNGMDDEDLWSWYRNGSGKQDPNGHDDRNEEPSKISLRCSTCFKTEKECGGKKHLLCRICMNALYCSKECQRREWKDHKAVCREGYIEHEDLNFRLRNVDGQIRFLFSLPENDEEAKNLVYEES